MKPEIVFLTIVFSAIIIAAVIIIVSATLAKSFFK